MAQPEEQEPPRESQQDRPDSDPTSASFAAEAPRDETALHTIRRLADKQISSVLQSFLGLPSTTQKPSLGEWATLEDKNDGDEEEKGKDGPVSEEGQGQAEQKN